MKNIKRSINSPCSGMYFNILTCFTGGKGVTSMKAIIQDSVSPIRAITKRVVKTKV